MLEASGDWRRIRTRHRPLRRLGACRLLRRGGGAEAPRPGAGTRRGGAMARRCAWARIAVRLPLRGRVALEGDAIRLPDGRRGKVVEGTVAPAADAVPAARAKAPERWALEHFAGSPYEWGGVTPCGVDCSGIVQTTFLARGVALPRDSAQQVACGAAVSPDALRPGDLLFFRSDDGPAHHPRRLRRRGGHAGAFHDRLRRRGAGALAAREAAPRRSATGSWRSGGWRSGDAEARPVRHRRHHSAHRRRGPPGHRRCAGGGGGRRRRLRGHPVRRQDRSPDRGRDAGGRGTAGAARVAADPRAVRALRRAARAGARAAHHPHHGDARSAPAARPVGGRARRRARPAHRQRRRRRRAQAPRRAASRPSDFGSAPTARTPPTDPTCRPSPPGAPRRSSAGCRAAREVVIIGDTPADIACGAGIGARALGVATGAYSVAELAGLRGARGVRGPAGGGRGGGGDLG